MHRRQAKAGPGPSTGKQGMELGGTLAGEGIPAGPSSRSGGGLPGPPASGRLPAPPPLNTAAAMVALARSGVKLSSEQKRLLSGSERKAVKKMRKEAKKVGVKRGWGGWG
jgi:hypothetical protein